MHANHSDAKQTANESDDKQRQSDYEYTLAHLPALTNYPNQDFSVAYGLLRWHFDVI
jgi:hypothetical protein